MTSEAARDQGWTDPPEIEPLRDPFPSDSECEIGKAGIAEVRRRLQAARREANDA